MVTETVSPSPELPATQRASPPNALVGEHEGLVVLVDLETARGAYKPCAGHVAGLGIAPEMEVVAHQLVQMLVVRTRYVTGHRSQLLC